MAFDPDEWRRAEDFDAGQSTFTVPERYAWTLVFVVGFGLVVTSLWEFVVGPADSTAAFSAVPAFFRAHHYLVIAFGLVVMGLAAGPQRRRERWAWALLWVVPAAVLGVALENLGVNGSLWPGQLALAALAAAGLLLSVRTITARDGRA